MVGIVIVNYNGAKFQNECIETLKPYFNEKYRIIIVDNCSTDNSLELLDGYDLDIIKLKENVGVAEGNNVGINRARELGCEYVLLLNNDTEVQSLFLEKMLDCNEDVVVPKIFFYNTNVMWYAGGKINNFKGSTEHLNYKKQDKDIKYKKYYDYAPTCCMLIKTSVFDKIGLMDKDYFLYFDDSDFCYRLKKHRIKIRFCEQSAIYHKVSLSTGGDKSPLSLYYGTRNRFYYIKKNKIGFIAYLYARVTRTIKIIISKIKKNNEWRFIKEGIKDYKQKNLFRKDDLRK